MLRGAISGFGEVAARAHLAGWASCPDVAIVAVHDPIAARRHAAINLIKNIRVYDDLELMLEGEKLDFVDIASPPSYHATTAQMALASGAHVLIEKPLCLEHDELDSAHSVRDKSLARTDVRAQLEIFAGLSAGAPVDQFRPHGRTGIRLDAQAAPRTRRSVGEFRD